MTVASFQERGKIELWKILRFREGYVGGRSGYCAANVLEHW